MDGQAVSADPCEVVGEPTDGVEGWEVGYLLEGIGE